MSAISQKNTGKGNAIMYWLSAYILSKTILTAYSDAHNWSSLFFFFSFLCQFLSFLQMSSSLELIKPVSKFRSNTIGEKIDSFPSLHFLTVCSSNSRCHKMFLLQSYGLRENCSGRGAGYFWVHLPILYINRSWCSTWPVQVKNLKKRNARLLRLKAKTPAWRRSPFAR